MLIFSKRITSSLVFQRRFGPLFFSQFLGALNDNLLRFSIIIFLLLNIYHGDSSNSRVLVVTTGAIFILPFFLFSSLAGEVADKYEKSALVRHIKSTEILIAVIASLGFVLINFHLLLFALFMMGTQSTFFGPLKYALLPQQLKKDELTSANAMLQAGTYLAIMTGTILGGYLAGLGELAPILVTIHILVLAILGRLVAQFIPLAESNDCTIKISLNLPKATFSIVRTAISDPLNLILIFLISGFWFTSSVYVSAVPTYAKLLLNADANVITLLNVAFVLGIGLGAFVCAHLSKGQVKIYLVFLGAVGVSLTSFHIFMLGTPPTDSAPLLANNLFASSTARVLFTDLLLIGAFGAIYVIPLYAALQMNLKSSHRARTIAALNVSNALFMVFSAAFAILAYRQGANEPQLFGLTGLMSILIVLCVFPSLTKLWGNLVESLETKN